VVATADDDQRSDDASTPTTHWVLGADRRSGIAGLVVSGALVAGYAVYLAHLTSNTYRHYGYDLFDIAFYDQGLWLLSRFHAPYLTIVGRNLFGDHAQFSLLALVPLYWVRPDATTLLDVQALVMASGAIPVYLLAMRRLRRPLFATVFVAAFLLYPALAQTNLENYHPDSFLIPLLGFAIYAAVENRPRMFVVCTLLALLCKEDVVAVVLPLALWYAWRHNRRVGGAIAGASIFFAFFTTNVVMKSLVGISTRNAARIPFSSCVRSCSVTRHVSDFVKEVVTKPGHVVSYLLASDRPNGRPFYVWQMLAPTGLVFLAAPEVAATVVLALAVNVLSTVGPQHQIAFHYSMVLIPGLMMGTVYAVSRLRTARRQAIAVGAVAVSALTCAVLWGPFPFSRQPAAPPTLSSSATLAVDRVIARLPAHAVVSADDRFVPHVDHRDRVYLWPTPFAASHWHLGEVEGKPLPFAAEVEYLLLPATLGDHPEVFARIRAGFVEVAREDAGGQGAVLYRRLQS